MSKQINRLTGSGKRNKEGNVIDISEDTTSEIMIRDDFSVR